MAVKKISESEFQSEVIKSSIPVVVDFNAQWCGPCRMLAPVLETVSEKIDNVKIVSIDTDENPEVAGLYNITGIPCLIIFKGGKEIKRIVGFKPEQALISEIKNSI